MEEEQEIDMSLINEDELMEEYIKEKESYKAVNGPRAHLDYGLFLSQKREEAEKEGNIELAKCYSKLTEKYWEELEESIKREEWEEEQKRQEEARELQEEREYREMARNAEIEKINAAFLSSGYEAFGAFIEEEIELARKNNDSDREWILEEAWKEYFEKSKKEFEAENENEDTGISVESTSNDSLESLTTEELIELATRNQGTINENEQVIKDALIKRILEQQQEIGEQEEEIKRLRGQKVI